MREIKIIYRKGPSGMIEIQGVSVNVEAFENMVGCPISLEGEVVGEVQSVKIVEAGVEIIGTIKEVGMMTIHEKLVGEKRNIEWSQLSWNWMSGCDGPGGTHCKGCYAKRIATRLRGRYGYPKYESFKVVLHKDKMDLPTRRKKPTVYFSVSMGDWMFAEPNWRKTALEIMKNCPQHIFVTLTKQYDNLWMLRVDSPMGIDGVRVVAGRIAQNIAYQIPKNVIIGISVTNREQVRGIDKLREVDAFTKLVCFEPLLEDVSDLVDLTGINWIIIGRRTRQGRILEFMPEKEWVDRLVAKARELDIPVFLKPSMTGITDRWPTGWEPVQETPYERIREALQSQQLITRIDGGI